MNNTEKKKIYNQIAEMTGRSKNAIKIWRRRHNADIFSEEGLKAYLSAVRPYNLGKRKKIKK